MGSALQASAMIAAAPSAPLQRKVVREVTPVLVMKDSAVNVAEGFTTPEQDEGDGEDSEPPSEDPPPVTINWYPLRPTLVCPGLGLYCHEAG